jgi:hypothetical protein
MEVMRTREEGTFSHLRTRVAAAIEVACNTADTYASTARVLISG